MKNSERIDKMVKNFFFFYPSNCRYKYNHFNLCNLFHNTEFETEWRQFWSKINTKNNTFIVDYFEDHEPIEAEALLRLLVVEDFKMYMDNKQC